MFARTLVELGKDYELKFYLNELERLYAATNSPEVGFQLGVVYSIGAFSNLVLSKKIFEKVVAQSSDIKTTTKAKMFLANIYDSQNDVAACRRLVDTMETTDDERLNTLVDIWKAKVFKDEGKFAESNKIIQQVLKHNSIDKDWYSFFSAKIILSSLRIKEGKREESLAILKELKSEFKGKNYKSVQDQIQNLEKRIAESEDLGVLTIDESEDVLVVSFGKNSGEIEKRSTLGKILKAFLKYEILTKSNLIKIIYDRDYAGETDNKLIYYHIHSLRKELEKLGLTASAIEKNCDGYRFLPQIKNIKGEMSL